MKPNRWIALSRWIYARLLNLYPREHHIEYGPSMLQLFTDQCRSEYQGKGVWGLVMLWPHTLSDLFANSLREQLASPRLLWGLLEAVPNEPLPWKGVLLVSIPGLIFFAGQISQLSGGDWFFLLSWRAAYLLIIPVLLIGLFVRKVPIWGLIPIGLLYSTIWWVIYRLEQNLVSHTIPYLSRMVLRKYTTGTLEAAVCVGVLTALVLSIGWVQRRKYLSNRVWIWMGVYGLLMTAGALCRTLNAFPSFQADSLAMSEYLPRIWYWNFQTYGGFLLLILFGALLARRHGRLVVLLPLGYLLPTILFGRFDADWETPQFMVWISAGAVVFRLLVALIAPTWILRTAPGEAQRRATIISFTSALAIQIILAVGVSNLRGALSVGVLSYMVLEQLILVSGIFLALELYQTVTSTKPESRSSPLAA
jgi:hypothetical protein